MPRHPVLSAIGTLTRTPPLVASTVVRVLITGGAGFIGSHFVDRLLAAGHEVRVLDSLDPQVHNGWPDYLAADVERMEGDVRDRDAVRRALGGVDRLVHLAAAVGVGQSMYEIERYTSVNALGAAVVLEAAMELRGQLEKAVVASSMSIYGEGLYRCPSEDVLRTPEPRSDEQLSRREWELICPTCGTPLEPVGTPESKPLQPLSIYAVGKRDHEEMFLAWGRAYKVPTRALRSFQLYGKRQPLSNPYTGVAAFFAARLLNGRPPIVFEDGRQSRDFVHVTDIAAGIEAALEPGRGDFRAINLGTGVSTSVLRVAEVLARELGVDVKPELRQEYRAADIRHCFADISLAQQELSYEPRVVFDDGMSELAGWLADQEAVDRVEEATAALVERGLAG
jgi:dTDP-L-rhamnose 4-epimerase